MNNDLISREALKKALRQRQWHIEDIEEVEKIINNAPTVEITDYDTGYQDGCEDGLNGIRPIGEWIKGREISRTMIGNKVQHIDYKDYTCSNCGLVLDNLLYWYDGSPFYKYCPNCGADMRGGRE